MHTLVVLPWADIDRAWTKGSFAFHQAFHDEPAVTGNRSYYGITPAAAGYAAHHRMLQVLQSFEAALEGIVSLPPFRSREKAKNNACNR